MFIQYETHFYYSLKMIVTIYEEVVLTKSYNYFHSDTIGFAQQTLTVTVTVIQRPRMMLLLPRQNKGPSSMSPLFMAGLQSKICGIKV